jgi:hypothetical protein
MLDMERLVVFEVESTAEWRRETAERFPEDAERNETAADRLDRIAADLRALKGTLLHARTAKLAEEDRNNAFSVAASELNRAIGFRLNIENGREYLETLCDLVE